MRLLRRRDDFWPYSWCDLIDRHNRFREVELLLKVSEELIASREHLSTIRLPAGPFTNRELRELLLFGRFRMTQHCYVINGVRNRGIPEYL